MGTNEMFHGVWWVDRLVVNAADDRRNALFSPPARRPNPGMVGDWHCNKYVYRG